jgi:hypothetical protein
MTTTKLLAELGNMLDGFAAMNTRLGRKHPLHAAYEAIYHGIEEFELELAEALDIPSRRDREDARAIDMLAESERWQRTSK